MGALRMRSMREVQHVLFDIAQSLDKELTTEGRAEDVIDISRMWPYQERIYDAAAALEALVDDVSNAVGEKKCN